MVDLPILEISKSDNNQSHLEYLQKNLSENDWLVFTSRNGVNSFTKELLSIYFKKPPRIAAIGAKTVESLEATGVGVEYFPQEANSKSFVKDFSSKYKAGNTGKLYLLRGDTAGKILPEGLSEAGFSLEELVVYHSKSADFDATTAQYFLKASKKKTPILIFSSSLTAEFFKQRLEENKLTADFKNIPVAVIGPETKSAVEALGFKVLAQAQKATMESLVEGITTSLAH